MSDPEAIFLPADWLKALCSGDVDAVMAMYSEHAVLVPTFQNDPLQGTEELTAYFTEFMERPNLCGESFGEIDQNLHENHRAISGTYVFSWGANETAAARFTFVVHFDADKYEWVIYTQHSSAMPEATSTF